MKNIGAVGRRRPCFGCIPGHPSASTLPQEDCLKGSRKTLPNVVVHAEHRAAMGGHGAAQHPPSLTAQKYANFAVRPRSLPRRPCRGTRPPKAAPPAKHPAAKPRAAHPPPARARAHPHASHPTPPPASAQGLQASFFMPVTHEMGSAVGAVMQRNLPCVNIYIVSRAAKEATLSARYNIYLRKASTRGQPAMDGQLLSRLDGFDAGRQV